jgi:hypothetical protein
MFNEDEMYEGPDPSPLHCGDQLFMNDQAQLELDALENYAYHGYKRGAFSSYWTAFLKESEVLHSYLWLRGRSLSHNEHYLDFSPFSRSLYVIDIYISKQ